MPEVSDAATTCAKDVRRVRKRATRAQGTRGFGVASEAQRDGGRHAGSKAIGDGFSFIDACDAVRAHLLEGGRAPFANEGVELLARVVRLADGAADVDASRELAIQFAAKA